MLPLRGTSLLSEGGTPLLELQKGAEYAGLDRVLLKDESRNPTGSFKDRGSSVSIQHAGLSGYQTVGTVSRGNMAISMAAFAARSGKKCLILVPEHIPPERVAAIATYKPMIIPVSGDYSTLFDVSLQIGKEYGIVFSNSISPMRIEGQKTVAYEICEDLLWHSPDAVVLPVSSGGNLSAVWKGFFELENMRAISKIPRIYGVQAAACAPIARAFDKGLKKVEPVIAGATLAFSIANANPPSGDRALHLVRNTNGGMVSVSDEEISEAKEVLAEEEGINLEAAGAASLAALRKLASISEVRSTEDAVIIGTGVERNASRTVKYNYKKQSVDTIAAFIGEMLAQEKQKQQENS